MDKWVVVVIIVLLVPVTALGGAVVVTLVQQDDGPDTSDNIDDDGYGDLGSNQGSSHPNFDPHNMKNNYTEADGPSFSTTDYAYEGSSFYYNFSLALGGGRYLKTITFRLNWTDEPDMDSGPVEMPNEPDEFKMNAVWQKPGDVPDSQELEGDSWGRNDHTHVGSTSIEIEVIHTLLEVQRGEGQWSVKLTVTAGDYGKPDKPVYPTQEDPGNDFTLNIVTTVYVPKEV